MKTHTLISKHWFGLQKEEHEKLLNKILEENKDLFPIDACGLNMGYILCQHDRDMVDFFIKYFPDYWNLGNDLKTFPEFMKEFVKFTEIEVIGSHINEPDGCPHCGRKLEEYKGNFRCSGYCEYEISADEFFNN